VINFITYVTLKELSCGFAMKSYEKFHEKQLFFSMQFYLAFKFPRA